MELEITNCTECALCLNKYSFDATATAKSFTKRRNGKTGIQGLHKNISCQAGADGLVEDQLQIIFLLRNVLDIPQKHCCDFLQVYGNPSLWIDCCDLCSDLVGMAKTIFDEIIMLQRKFEKLQNQIKNKIVQTVKLETVEGFGDESQWGVKETIRSFFNPGISSVKSTLAKEEIIQDLSSDLDATELISCSRTDLNSCFVENEGIDEDRSLLIQHSGSSNEYITCKPEEPMSLLDDRGISYLTNTFPKEEKTENISNTELTKVSYLPVTSLNLDDVRIQNIEEDDFLVYQSGYSKCKAGYNVHDSEEQDPLRLDEAAGSNKDFLNIKEETSCHPVHILPNEELRSQSETNFNLDISTSSFDISECWEDADSESNSTNGVNIHNGRKSYKCSFSNILVDSSRLKRNESIHTEENRYECSFCGKHFPRMQNLKNHERIHTGEKPYKCEICGKGFTQAGSLKRHESIHTGEKPFKCSFCEKAFARVSYLKDHEKIHTGVKPYECKFCERRFTQANHLKNHESVHTGEKPYECKVCKKRFAESRNLKRHEGKHIVGAQRI